jgi:hypothetical protein
MSIKGEGQEPSGKEKKKKEHKTGFFHPCDQHLKQHAAFLFFETWDRFPPSHLVTPM